MSYQIKNTEKAIEIQFSITEHLQSNLTVPLSLQNAIKRARTVYGSEKRIDLLITVPGLSSASPEITHERE